MINNCKRTIFSKACFFFGLSVLLVFTSCVRQSDMQTEGASYLQGVWVQDSIPNQNEMMDYTLHEFTFTCDSIYTKMHNVSKVQRMVDSCYQDGKWSEYAQGVYVVRGDSILAEGIYTRENGKQKISGCYKIGQYLPRFKIASYSKDSLVLENRFDQRPIVLRKVKDIVCVPKKRWEMN
ncbi:fumarate hydratase [Sphingobacterium hungaricum]|uniref:fumarate hydratase n=1 Tax=Sphingobacterium hungaricum TaxID=2082723 RepID=UPI001E5F3459|nr:fumarate hydratase [Sphingobacterium hungaricum]